MELALLASALQCFKGLAGNSDWVKSEKQILLSLANHLPKKNLIDYKKMPLKLRLYCICYALMSTRRIAMRLINPFSFPEESLHQTAVSGWVPRDSLSGKIPGLYRSMQIRIRVVPVLSLGFYAFMFVSEVLSRSLMPLQKCPICPPKFWELLFLKCVIRVESDKVQMPILLYSILKK